ncbi:MAG TPA: polyprenyl diphosphate synthase [Dehalococcoidia bacterium]|nr:polyprenyl diphosphate synthase [Dehalococcoidia bacterium]
MQSHAVTSDQPRSVEWPEPAKLPRHVAIIMDGNGRWARTRGLPRLAGHRAGTENVRRIVESMHQAGVGYLTLYAFSTENWGRPASEVDGLMDILGEAIDREAANLHQQGVRILHLGDLDQVRPDLQVAIRRAVDLTRHNPGLTLSVAFNYGGRADIVQAVRRLIAEGIAAEDVDEAAVSRRLYTAGIPDPDLIVRTAGEMRLSNFLIWQAAYAEYYSTPVFWPDFGVEEVAAALHAYARRHRRFGGLAGDEGLKAGRGA